MKKMIVLLLGVILMYFNTFGAEISDRIVGKWKTQGKGESIIEITKKDGKFFGKLIWLLHPNYEKGEKNEGEIRVDVKNPDEKKRSIPILGLEILTDFKYRANDKKWVDGKIYDPESGNIYFCSMVMEGNDILSVTGSVDQWGWLGRTVKWTREN